MCALALRTHECSAQSITSKHVPQNGQERASESALVPTVRVLLSQQLHLRQSLELGPALYHNG